MRRLSFLFALFALLTLSAQAQTVSSCTVSGILYKTTNVPCTSCTLQIVQVEVDGAVTQTVAQTATSDATTGAISFTVPQRSIATIRGNFVLGRYSFVSGIRLYIPASSTANLHELLSEADALRTLTATGYAPSSATFITRTAEAGLSAEFSLGLLTSGLLKHTVSGSTSTPATAVAGTDYVAPGAITTSGLTLSSGVLLGRTTASTGAPENITPSARFDFASGALDLATSGVSAGTCTNCDLTIDAYGRVTAKANGTSGGGGAVSSVFGRTGAVVAATNDYTWAQIDKTTSSLADITTRSASDLSSGTLPLARLSGITDTELSASAAIALSKLAALTASRAAVTDASGVLTASSVTSTELGYLSGVTSAIQTQLGNKQDLDSDLTALAGNSTNGLWARTGAGTGAARTITGTTDKITVTNGDGVSGNPTLTIASTYTGQNTITTLGTITTGTWNGAVIGAAYGGAGTVSGLLKANGSGTVSAAVSGTDYAPATSGSAILKGNGSGGFSAAVAGTDYLAPTGSGASLTNVVNSITGTSNQVTASASTGAVTLSLPQDIATTSNTRFGNLGLGVAAPTSGGQISATLGANNITGLLIKRNTDTGPTGNYFDFQNAAGTTVAKLDVAGALTVTSCTGCGGGGSGITVGTTTITSGTNTRIPYNNAGVYGEISGFTSDGTNVTAGSGNLRATSPRITTEIDDANGAPMLIFSPTTSATQAITIANNTATNAVSLTASAPAAATATTAGTPFNLSASAATAGTTTAGAAAGGSITITTGAAARLTSGNANGGDLNFVVGAGVGTGTAGLAAFTESGSSHATRFRGQGAYSSRIGLEWAVSGAVRNTILGAMGSGNDLIFYGSGGTTEYGRFDGSGNWGIGTGGTVSARLHSLASTSNTNAVADAVRFSINSTGTAASGFGGRIAFGAETSTTNDTQTGALEFGWKDATHASRTAFLDVRDVYNAGSLATLARFTEGRMSLMRAGDVNPGTSELTSLGAASIYVKGSKFVIAYNNAGTITYITIPLDGSTATWTHSTTAP